MGNGTKGGILRTYRGLHAAQSTYSFSDKNFMIRSDQGRGKGVAIFLSEHQKSSEVRRQISPAVFYLTDPSVAKETISISIL